MATASQSEAILTTLLAAAKTLRSVADDPAAADRETPSFRRSTLGLAALIEAWCVDNAVLLMPELLAGRVVAGPEDESALLEEIVARVWR